jgi:hypothetical protein
MCTIDLLIAAAMAVEVGFKSRGLVTGARR